MDKNNNTRPYDDLNKLVEDDKEDTEMDEGEAGEGGESSSTQPANPIPRGRRVPIPADVANMFNNNNNPLNPPPFFNTNYSIPNLNELAGSPPPSNLVGPPIPPGMRAPRDEGPNIKQFDFRHNKMPEGVAIIGEGELELQQDKSTALALGPKSCLSLNRMKFCHHYYFSNLKKSFNIY